MWSISLPSTWRAVKDVTMLTANEMKLADELIQILKLLRTVRALMKAEITPVSTIIPLQENDAQIHIKT